MTVILAIQHGDKTVCASDSEVTIFDTVRCLNLVNESKLYRFKDVVVGVCGGGALSETLEYLQNDASFMGNFSPINTRIRAIEFARQIFLTLRELTEVAPSNELSSVGTLLIVSPGHIYAVYSDLSISEFSKYCAFGGGADIAKGIIAYAYRRLTDPSYEALEGLAIEAVKEASAHIQGVGGNVHTERLIPMSYKPKGKRKTNKKSSEIVCNLE